MCSWCVYTKGPVLQLPVQWRLPGSVLWSKTGACCMQRASLWTRRVSRVRERRAGLPLSARLHRTNLRHRYDGKQQEERLHCICHISLSLICASPSPLMSRADVSRRDGEGATQAPPPHENMHVHQQDSPHGLSAVLPGHGAPWRLLRRHQNQEEEGGFPLHWRHLVLRGDGNCSGVWLLQVPVVTAPQFVCSFRNTHRCHFVNSTRQCREIFPRWWAPSLCDFFFPPPVWPLPICRQEKPQTKMGHVCVFLTERKYIVRYKWEKT